MIMSLARLMSSARCAAVTVLLENWVQLQPLQSPPARDSMGMAYDFSNHEQIMFGGVGLNRLYNDTWKLIRH